VETHTHEPDLLAASDLWKSFGAGFALAGAELTVARGKTVAIVGASGSGKSTLLQCLAGISLPDKGSVRFGDVELTDLDDDNRSRLRISEFGFVFQFADLVPELTIAENIALPLELARRSRSDVRDRVGELLQKLGIVHLADQRPQFVSGGERQRAAVARAVVSRPSIVFADEPTGALDSHSRELVLELLLSNVRGMNASLVLVTHDPVVAASCDEQITMVDGAVVERTTARRVS